MRPAHTFPIVTLFAGMSIVVLAGCDVTIKDGDVSINRSQGRASREWNRTYALTPGGRVEVVNVNGPVEVTAGPEGTVTVAAVLTARAMTDERANEILAEAAIEESAAPDHVRVASARRERSRGAGGLEVSYKVTVPPDARVDLSGNNGSLKAVALHGPVKVMMVNGDLELTGMRGTIDAASINGEMTVSMAEVSGRIRLESTNGRVHLEVPKSARATLDARAMNGGIRVTGLDTQEVEGHRIRNLESVLNGGGPEIVIRANNGRISIEGK